MVAGRSLDLSPSHIGSLHNIPFRFFPLDQKNSSFLEHHDLMFLFAIGQLGGLARTTRFHSAPRAGQ
jgi:hypothetical protein